MEAPKLNNLKDFLEWLFSEYNVPESSQFKLSKEYAAKLPQENCDFEYLKKCIETEWKCHRTKSKLPYTGWLNYHIQPIPNKNNPTQKLLQEYREIGAQIDKNRPKIVAMIREKMNSYRKKLGKPIKEYE